jgi:hypothetical protein
MGKPLNSAAQMIGRWERFQFLGPTRKGVKEKLLQAKRRKIAFSETQRQKRFHRGNCHSSDFSKEVVSENKIAGEKFLKAKKSTIV